jgi:hypothetical protein
VRASSSSGDNKLLRSAIVALKIWKVSVGF